MKKLIIISDSHGNRRAIDELDGIFAESDYIIHLGDTSADGGYIRGKYPDKTVVINGNCDPVKLGDDERVLEVEDMKFPLPRAPLFGKVHPCKAYGRGEKARLQTRIIRAYAQTAGRRSGRRYPSQPRLAFEVRQQKLPLCGRQRK